MRLVVPEQGDAVPPGGPASPPNGAGLAPDVGPGTLRIELLGRFRIGVDGRPVGEAAWRLRKARTLLKFLALAPGHRLHRDQLASTLWPDLEAPAAANNLKQAIHVARRALEPHTTAPGGATAPASPPGSRQTTSSGTAQGAPALPWQGDLLCLSPDGHLWIDVDAFETAAGVAAGAQDAGVYREAIALYTGDLLLEDLYEDWATDRRERLRGIYLGLLVRLANVYLRTGEYHQAIDALQRVLAGEPAHEEAHVGLMRALALTGQPHQARRQFQLLQETLRRDLDMSPSLTSEQLHQDIVAGRFPPSARAGSAGSPTRDAPTPEVPPVSGVWRPEGMGPDPAGAGTAGVGAPGGGAPDASQPGAGSHRERGGHNLPAQLTSFVGRESEIAEVQGALARGRLLTLTGTGGSGKTRLALQVAGAVLADYPDGVWLVELAPVADDARVIQAVAEALGVGEEPDRPLLETVVEAARQRHQLLVLDNCERLVGGCAIAVDVMLRNAPGLKVLATSRQALGIQGEVIWRVPPLRLPPARALVGKVPPARLQALVQYDAVRLFLDRASASRRDFALTAENAVPLVTLCQRLDGLPLALELAAARVRVLSVEQIAARLDDRFRLLTGGSRTAPLRQRTLLAAVAWSYDLLPPAERLLFDRLAVFAGGWTLDAAEQVCADDDGAPASGALDPAIEGPDVLDLLAQLVDKSLVLVEEADGSGEVRYRLLETLRDYARERLDAGQGATAAMGTTGAGAAVRRRHAHYYLTLAETVAGHLTGAKQARWLNRLETEHDNLRSALHWAAGQEDRVIGLRLGVALARFWSVRSYLSEGREWLARLLDRTGTGPTGAQEVALRAQALNAAGFFAWGQGDYGAARGLYQGAHDQLTALGDRQGVAGALFGLGQIARIQGDDRQSRTLYRESLAIYQGIGDRRGVANVLRDLGHVASDEGDHEVARRHYAESLTIAQQLGDRSGTANAMMYLGLQAYHQGTLDLARTAYEASLAIWRELGNRRAVAELLRLLGEVAFQQGDLPVATTFHADSLAMRREVGDRFGIAECLLSLGDTARHKGEDARAGALYRESLGLYQDLGSKRLMAVCLVKLAGVLASDGRSIPATRLLGAAEAELAALGAGLWPADRSSAEATAERLRAGLGHEAFAGAWEEGRAMPLGEAVLYALGQLDSGR